MASPAFPSPPAWRHIESSPRAAALLLGVVSATGFQPLGLWPLALAAMACFAVLAARCDNPGRAAWLGWLFGLGHFTFGNNWIATAFTHQAAMPPLLGWAAVPLLSAYLAIFPALAAAGARGLAGRGLGWPFAFAFAGCWIMAEILRAVVFTGYAWNPFAMVLLGPFDRPGMAALAPWTGTYALSGVALFLACAAALLVAARRWLALGLAALLLAAGIYAPAGLGREGTLALTLVQPDIRQHMLNDPAQYDANFERLASLSVPRGDTAPRLVLWPESGLVDYLQPGYPQRYYDRLTAGGDPEFARRRIGRIIGEGAMLLTGVVNLEIEDDRAVGAYNSVMALDEGGAIAGNYAKAHLVPYGEYLPMRPLLEPLGLSRLVPGAIDFLAGPGPRTLELGAHGRGAMQICYEIVFSGEVVGPGARPDYIFNPSNDGWFGSFGPPQHLAQARMRAIEEGLPVLRSTTTGISAVIDARGVVREYLDMNRPGRIDTVVPPPAAPTPFARLGHWLTLLWAAAFLAAAAVAMRRGAG